MIKIETARLARCNADGTRSDEGLYVLVDEIRITASNGASDVTLCALSYVDTDEDGNSVNVSVDVLSAVLINGYKETEPVLLGGKEFLLGFDYVITLRVTDSDGTAQTTMTVPRAFVNFHQSGATTGGAAFGMYSRAKDGSPMLESAFPFYGYGGVYGADGSRLDGAGLERLTVADGFRAYIDGKNPTISRIGKLVILSGEVTPTATIAGGTTEHTILTLPRDYWPAADVYQLCAGANYNKWVLHVSTGGIVTFSRYSSSSAASAAAGTQLPFSAVWIAGDYSGSLAVQRPAAGMTANSSQGCVASASGIIGTGYEAWRGFDYKETDAWVSSKNSNTMWLQLSMDVALTDITVSVYARQTQYPTSPVAGEVLARNSDSDSWTKIGSFSGWNGKQNGGLCGTIACGNEAAYKQVRLNITERAANTTSVAVGYMKITGYMPVDGGV